MVYETVQLTEEQISRFNRDGFRVIEKLIDAELVSRLRDRIDHYSLAILKRGFIQMNGTGVQV